jgi:enolase
VLPVPAFNMINGGSHAGNKLAMQEFMVLPVGAKTFKEAMQIGSEIYHHLKKVGSGNALIFLVHSSLHYFQQVVNKRYGLDATAVGDEGGFAPNIQDNKEGLNLLMESFKASGHQDKVNYKIFIL